MKYDVIIVGAGPGGIFSSYELVKLNPNLKIAVFEAGYSLENAFKIAYKELEGLYQNQKNPMRKQMRRMVQGLELHMSLESLMTDFADAANLEEARQFAVVIEIVRSTGGNMVEILKRTIEHLKYKMDK